MAIFDTPQYRIAFEKFRGMPDTIFDKYFACLALPNLISGQALDVGAGPGIQTEMLLLRLPSEWRITALEPSKELIASAMNRLEKYEHRMSFLQCQFEELFPQNKYNAIWISEVAHLLGNPVSWIKHLATIMDPGGRILIRTSTHTQLINRHWYRYFPTALQIDLARHPTKRDILKGLESSGFSHISATTINESRKISAQLLITMMAERAFSTLHPVSEDELSTGLQKLRIDLTGKSETMWHYEMTAYTATFNGGKS